MTTRRWLQIFAGASLFFTASHADAQVWGRNAAPRDGACFYEDANYRGRSFCVVAGDGVNNLPRELRDSISSIRVFGRADVTVFDGPQFRGQSEVFENDVQNLSRQRWNDTIQSIRVSGERGRGGFAGNQGRGRSGQNPDAIVRRAYDDILQREPDPAGMRLYRSRIIDDNWSEEDVRDALRNSREYRELTTMTPAKAREIVRSAYLSVLQREPDGASQTYVTRVLRDKWTQQDVERELRRSPEFNDRRREASPR